MDNLPDIHYLPHHEIDKEKWDRAVTNAGISSVYGYSWYLDAATDYWDALVMGDYEILLPLPWRKKWGIKYVYQPLWVPFIPMMGNHMDQQAINTFFLKSSEQFKWMHGSFNISPEKKIDTVIRPRTNYFFPIPETGEPLNYREKKEFKKNLRKSEGCKLTRNVVASDVVSFYKKAYGHYLKNSSELQYLERLLEIAAAKNHGDLYGIENEKEELIFAAALLRFRNRMIYIAGAPNTQGRQKSATHFFIDSIIRENTGKNLIFDFEGSEIPSVASFYKKFEPLREEYFDIKINNLPPLPRIIKKIQGS